MGKDAFTGTAGNDTFVAEAINPVTSAAATTLTATDALDGGAGTDTLNITVAGTDNATIVGTFANIETINIDNTTATSAAVTSGATSLVASGFVGATNINQIAKSANVTGLASTTTATFSGVTLGSTKNAGSAGATATYGTAQSVTAGSTATSASIALSAVKGDAATAAAVAPVNNTSAGTNATTANEAVLNVSGASLNSVTVSGTLAKNTGVSATANLVLNVTGGYNSTTGASVSSLAVNTAVKTTLTVANNGSATSGAIATVDASASAGAIKYVAATTVGTVRTGAGADVVTLQTATVKDNANTQFDETLNASLTTGAGKDDVTISTSGAGTTTVDTGADADKITISSLTATGAVSVTAGDGNDVVVLSLGDLTVGRSFSGGAGFDYLSLAATSFTLGDYAALKTYTNGFEGIALTGTNAVVDASQLSTDIVNIEVDAGATITKLGTQTVEMVGGAVTLTADGYVAAATTTYAGNVSIDVYNSNTATVNALSTDVDVLAGVAAAGADVLTLVGDVKSATVRLSSVRDLTATGTAAGTESVAGLVVDTNGAGGATATLGKLASLTVTGQGTVVIDNVKSTAGGAVDGSLTSIDLSGMTALVNLNIAGDQVTGAAGNSTTYGYQNLSTSSVTLNDSLAETVKLGGAKDTIATNSTVAKMDTIEGFALVASASDSTVVDTTKSDSIDIAGLVGAVQGIKAITIASGTADLTAALLQAGSASNTTGVIDNAVFLFGGNTYFYQDTGADGLTSNDVVIKLVGEYNLALLAQTIA